MVGFRENDKVNTKMLVKQLILHTSNVKGLKYSHSEYSRDKNMNALYFDLDDKLYPTGKVYERNKTCSASD